MWKHHGDDAWVIWGVLDVALPLQELEDKPLGGQREKLWYDFFLDPLQWWDHRSKKVIEHQSCQNSHVNAAIALVGVDLVRCLLVAILPW